MAQDLNAQEFDELDDLLAATPEPLDAMDVAMLDGYLCGLLVQPELLPLAECLGPVFDSQERALPADTDPAWHTRTLALIERRHAALRRGLAEEQWIDPLVLEMPEDAPPDADDDPAFTALPAHSKPLVPWVSGFVTAVQAFPNGLLSLTSDELQPLLDRIGRHLPASDDEERAVMAALDAERPLKSVDEAVEDLVLALVEIDALTEPERYHVQQVRHEAPKVGRNDPCPCGSGKKFKACHGKT